MGRAARRSGVALVAIAAAAMGGLATQAADRESNIPQRSRGRIAYGWEERAKLERSDVPVDLRSGPHPAVRVDRLEGATSYPLLMSERLSVFPGISVERTGFHFDDVALDDLESYVVSLPVSVRAPLWGPWGSMTVLSPGWHSDWHGADPDAFSLSVVALAMRQLADGVSVSVGAVYARDFGRDRLVPAAGAVWNPSPEWEVRLMYPAPRVTFAPSRAWRAFVSAGPAGGEWAVDDPRSGMGHGDFDWRYRATRAQVGAEWDVAGPLRIFVAGGRVFRRNLQLRDDGARLLDADADAGVDVSAGIAIR